MELAFYLWLGGKGFGIKWFSFERNASAADLAANPDIISNDIPIDVKGKPLGWDEFAVRRQTLNDLHAYVLATDDFYPEVRFYGYLFGKEIREGGFRVGGRKEIPCYCIGMDAKLHDCLSLMTQQRRKKFDEENILGRIFLHHRQPALKQPGPPARYLSM
jgi:hypothetical protein